MISKRAIPGDHADRPFVFILIINIYEALGSDLECAGQSLWNPVIRKADLAKSDQQPVSSFAFIRVTKWGNSINRDIAGSNPKGEADASNTQFLQVSFSKSIFEKMKNIC